jgi:site-specific DNA-methyltransferase (adenine-specific)
MIPELNQIILADCMDIMKDIPDKYFELAIVDPPYGINMDSGLDGVYSNSKKGKTFSVKKRFEKKSWDNSKPNKKYFDELFRVSKNQIIWGGNYFTDNLPVSRGWIFWDKKITNATSPNFSDGELAWTSFNKILKRFSYDWIGFGYLNNPSGEKKIHPTQKPVALYRWLLQNYAKPGDKIIDTHSGSGSLACACHLEKFDFLAIEKDADYHTASVKRLEELRSQGVLF